MQQINDLQHDKAEMKNNFATVVEQIKKDRAEGEAILIDRLRRSDDRLRQNEAIFLRDVEGRQRPYQSDKRDDKNMDQSSYDWKGARSGRRRTETKYTHFTCGLKTFWYGAVCWDTLQL